VEILRQRGVMVRDSSGNPGCEGCVRITVGAPAQMEEVLRSIRAACFPIKS
jgi:histidinol-phosphate/aromatic aminotransferase/cobyric acid decarboxylase-like protein